MTVPASCCVPLEPPPFVCPTCGTEWLFDVELGAWASVIAVPEQRPPADPPTGGGATLPRP